MGMVKTLYFLKNETFSLALEANGSSTSHLNGGFGSARLRRIQLAKSASSAKVSPCSGDGS